ncbi:MAG: hypothetical protein C0453_02005 [Comamonadaceae bacterium]|nr:hypothetical protein [Comamonadaceae bacterium]
MKPPHTHPKSRRSTPSGSVSTAPANASRAPLAQAAPVEPVVVSRAFSCRCGQPVFFRNSICLACQTPLGYDPQTGLLLPLVALPGQSDESEVWRCAEPAQTSGRYLRCRNLTTGAACNWLIPLDGKSSTAADLCLCCRFTRVLPDLSVNDHLTWWRRIEVAKRRLISALLGMRLPLVPLADDPRQGLAFDILTSLDGAPVTTGHAEGVITLDAQEADDPTRELRRTQLHEPYRTLLGHLRHEIGHYYWRRLVEHSEWIDPFRREFGDERADYLGALERHYAEGPPDDWCSTHVSAYASCHPWEDWAETWAHYMHMTDTVDTAMSFGLHGERLELSCEPFGTEVLGEATDSASDGFLNLLNRWVQLTGVLNELSRSMGVPDFYPFVLSAPAVRKLHMVHRIIEAANARWNTQAGYMI